MEPLMPVKNLILFPLFNIKEQDWASGTILAIYIHDRPNMITAHHEIGDKLIWSISYRCWGRTAGRASARKKMGE